VKYRTSTVEITSEYFINGQIKDGEETDHHNTLLHETAHVIVYHRYGRTVKAHGHEWKRVMHSLGVTPNRVGQSKVLTNANKAAKHVYTCKDCGQEFKKQRQLKNVDRRFHGKCRHNRHGGKLDHYQVR
jgi:predicted SprT family Zn-dependent metalloprotease